MTAKETAPGKNGSDGTFGMIARPEPTAESKVLRVPSDPQAEILIRGQIQFVFNGRTPVGPRDDRRVTEDGWIPIHLFDVVWDLVATCKRVVQDDTAREIVQLHPSDLTLDLERHDQLVTVRVRQPGSRVLPPAETRISVTALVRACLSLGSTLFTWIVITNPELRGNLRIKRFQGTLVELERAQA